MKYLQKYLSVIYRRYRNFVNELRGVPSPQMFLSADIHETEEMSSTIRTISVVFAIFMILLIWAGMSSMQETSSTQGELTTMGVTPIIQHEDGGVVKRLFTTDSARVVKGQKILELDPSRLELELYQNTISKISNEVDLHRLTALINKSKLDFNNFKIQESTINQVDILNAIENSNQLYSQQLESHRKEVSILENSLQQLQGQLANLKKQRSNLNQHKSILREEINIYKELAKSQATSKLKLLSADEKMSNSQREYLRLIGSIGQKSVEITEKKERLNQLKSQFKEELLQEFSSISEEQLQFNEKIEQIKSKLDKLIITAPESGIVKGLDLHPGSVIGAGRTLFELIPSSRKLVVTMKIPPKEIGHINLFDKVNVKVSAYNFTQYGTLDGHIASISPSTYLDERKQPYYKGIVELKRYYMIDTANKEHPLYPGMIVNIDIITGHKSLLSYILKPLKVSINRSFSEK